MSRRQLLFAFVLVAWFWYFCHDALAAHFAPDDLMNLDFYWRMKPVQLVTSHALIWRNFYRPMGALFYLPLYTAFRLDPKPYHVVILIILLANAWLVYRLATLLRAGPLAGGLASLVSCYHAGLSNLTYNSAFVYDVLCGFFYLAALVYYLHIREAGRHLRAREIAAFLGLYLCALNSKEMAVTLPLVLLMYEWTHHGEAALRVPFLAGLINLPYVYGKALRGDALASMEGYRMEFTWARVADFQLRSFRDLVAGYEIAAATIVWIYVVLFYLAWRRPRPVLRFCALFVLVAPLPIEFLPGRGSACLYLPFVGWAIFLAVVAVDVAGAAATFLAGEPGFRRLGKQALLGILLAGCVTLWGRENQHLKRSFIRPAMAQLGGLTWDVIGQFRTLRPQVRPGTTVVFLNDPFVDWDMAFIAELWFRDRSVNVRLHRKTPLPAEEIARAQHLFDWRDGKLIQLR